MAHSVGTIWVVNGEVYIQSEDGTIRKAKAGDEILANDLVKTFDGATIDIRLINGKILTLHGLKEILIDKSVYSDQEFAQEDVDVDVEEVTTSILNNNEEIQTAAGEVYSSSEGLTPLVQNHLNNFDNPEKVLNTTIENSEYGNEETLDVERVRDVDPSETIELLFPEAPTVEIPPITNNIGSSVEVKIFIPDETEIGSVLTLYNPDGSQENIEISEAILNQGFITREYATPQNGEHFVVSATLEDNSGLLSELVESKVVVDTVFGDGNTSEQIDALSIDKTLINESGEMKIIGNVGDANNKLESLMITDESLNRIYVKVDDVEIGNNGTFIIDHIDVSSLKGQVLVVNAIAIDPDGNIAVIPQKLHITPDAPTIVILEDGNDDGVINAEEAADKDGVIQVKVTFSDATQEGDILLLTKPTGETVPVDITQKMIDVGYIISFDLPTEGTIATISAQVTNKEGNTSLVGADSAQVELEFGDGTEQGVFLMTAQENSEVITTQSLEGTTLIGKIGEGSVLNSLVVSQGDDEIVIDTSSIEIAEDGTFVLENVNLSAFNDGILTTKADITDKYGNNTIKETKIELDTIYGDDVNGDGVIDSAIVEIIDKDGDGVITSEELSSSTLKGTLGEGGVSLSSLVISDGENKMSFSPSEINILEDGSYQITNINLSNFNDGDILVSASLIDQDGNTSTITNSIRLDTLVPVISFVEDENRDGTLNADEVNKDIEVKISLGRNSEVGQILKIESSNEEMQELKIDQNMIDNGYIQSFDTPKEGEDFTIKVSIIDLDGNESTASSKTLNIDTIYGDDLNNDGDIAPVKVSFLDANNDQVINATEAKDMKITGNIGEAGDSLEKVIVSDGKNSVEIDISHVVIGVDGSYTIRDIDFSNLEDSNLKVDVISKDVDGNTATTSATILLDTEYGNDLDHDGKIDEAFVDIEDADGNGIINNKELTSSIIKGNVGEDGKSLESITLTDGLNTMDIDLSDVEIKDDGSYMLKNIDLTPLTLDGELTLNAIMLDKDGNSISKIDTIAKDSILHLTFDNIKMTGDTTPRFSGTIDSDIEKVIVRMDGDEKQEYEAKLDLEDGKWTLKWPTPLSHGEHDVAIIATDSSGNKTTVQEYEGFIIHTDISATIDSINDNNTSFITDSNQLVVHGTIDGDPDTLEVRVDAKVYTLHDSELLIDDDGNWTLDLTDIHLPDKEYDVSVEYIDDTNNAAYVAQKIIIDTDETITVDDFTNANGTTNDDTIKLSGTTENAKSVHIILTDNENNKTQQEAFVDENGNWSLVTDNLKDGDYTLNVYAKDAVGNEVISEDKTFRVDTSEKITLTLDDIQDGDDNNIILSNSFTPVLTGTVVNASSLRIEIKDVDKNEGDEADVTLTTGDCDNCIKIDTDNNTWSVLVPKDKLAEKEYTIKILAKETGVGEEELDSALHINQDLPSVSLVSFNDIDISSEDHTKIETNDPLSNIKGTMSDDTVRVSVTIDGKTFDAQLDHHENTWSVDIPSYVAISEGEYTFDVKAYNAYGSHASASDSFFLDTTPPTLTLDDVQDVENAAPVFSGTVGGDIDKVIVTIGKESFEADISDHVTWSLEWPVSLNEGNYNVEVLAEDKLGNGIIEKDEFRVDISSDKEMSLHITTDFVATETPNPTFYGTSHNVNKVIVTVNGDEYTTTTDSDGNWKVTLENPLDSGRYILDVTGKQDDYFVKDSKVFLIDQEAEYHRDNDVDDIAVQEGHKLYNETSINTNGYFLVSVASDAEGSNAMMVDDREFQTSLGGSVVLHMDGTFEYDAPVLSHETDSQSKEDYFYFKESNGDETTEWKRFSIDVVDSFFEAHDDSREVGYEGNVGGNLLENDSGLKAEKPTIVKLSYNGEDFSFNDFEDSIIKIDTDFAHLEVQRDGSYTYTSTTKVPVIHVDIGSENEDNDEGDEDSYHGLSLKGFTNEDYYLDEDGNLKIDENGKIGDDDDASYTETDGKYSGIDSVADEKEEEEDDDNDMMSSMMNNNNDDDEEEEETTTDVINDAEGMVIDFQEARAAVELEFSALDAGEQAVVKLFDKDGKFLYEETIDGDNEGVTFAKDGLETRYISVTPVDDAQFGIKGASYTPLASEVDHFSYTMQDADRATQSEATLVVKHTFTPSIVNDFVEIDEADLSTSDTHTSEVTGNLLENDKGLINEKITTINGQLLEDGHIIIDDDHGYLEVFENGDYTYTLTSNTTYLEDDKSAFEYELDSGLKGTLNVHVNDDNLATTSLQTLSVSSHTRHEAYNLTLVIDKSGSLALGSQSAEYAGMSNMDMTKDAINSILDKYSQMGKLNVNIIDFSDSVDKSGWILDNENEAKNYINFMEPNGETSYEDALYEVISSGANGPDTPHNILYFITDGSADDNAVELSDTLQSQWNDFRDNTFSEVYAIGFGDNYENTSKILEAVSGQENNIIVPTATDLYAALNYSIGNSTSVYGDLIADDSVFHFGADGGYITSMEVDGITYTYDKEHASENQGAAITTVTTKLGGIFSINWLSGEYSYQADVSKSQAGEHERFHFNAVDGDGDVAQSTLNIDLKTYANIDTNNDIIITNITDGFIEIPAWSLLNNDNNNYDLHIDKESKAKYMDIDFDKETGLIKLEGYADYQSDFGKEIQTLNDKDLGSDMKHATLLARENFGHIDVNSEHLVKDASMPTMRIEGALDGDADFMRVTLKKGEWLVLDIDNGYDYSVGNDGENNSVDSDLTLYDADGNVIDMNIESKVVSGGDGSNYKYDPFLSFMAKEDGEYFIKVSANEQHDDEGTYTLMASIVPTFEQMSFEYTAEDSIDIDIDRDRASSSIVNFMRTASQILHGTESSEVLIANDNDTILDAQGGNDALLGGDDSDTALGGAGDDTIKAGKGDDVLEGNSGNDTLYGEDGNDDLDGGSGHDILDGGIGSDILKGSQGNDTLVYDSEDTLVDGGENTDTLLVDGDIDFAQVKNIRNIEAIDLRDGEEEHITLDAESIIDMSDGNNTITIYGDEEKDSLTVKNGDGLWEYSGQETDKDNNILNIYEQDGTVIKIDHNITLDFE